MQFDAAFGTSRSARRQGRETPRHILVLSDLRGDAAEPADPVGDRSIFRVDIDNIDDVLARHAPSVVLGAQAGGERLQFRTFTDFHPDALIENARVFDRLLDLRRRLQHPETFASALAELGAEASRDSAASEPATTAPSADDAASTFERLLGHKTPAAPLARQPSAVSAVDALIRRIVAPHVVAAVDPQVPQLLSAVDVALSDVMRAVLHDPGFQRVEATWRGIQWLVSSIELGEELELHLLHVTRDELSESAGPKEDLYRRLVEDEARTEGGLEFSAILGNYRFDATSEDLTLLESVGSLARALSAPFVAEGGASLLGSRGIAQQPDPREWATLAPEIGAAWAALRSGPAGRWLGLSLPRVLLRLPYGAKSDPIDGFRFEEMPGQFDHESFLWGNPAFACAVVMARMLQPDAALDDPGDISDLPAFVFTVEDEPHLQPCAEASLSERAVEAVLASGIIPLVSARDRPTVRLVRLQSLANPPTGLLR